MSNIIGQNLELASQDAFEGGKQEMQEFTDIANAPGGGSTVQQNPAQAQGDDQRFSSLQRRGTINMIGSYNRDLHASRSINFRQADQALQ